MGQHINRRNLQGTAEPNTRGKQERKTHRYIYIYIWWRGGVCSLSLCTNAESREWVVNCLINICHFRCCNNTLCLARPKNTKHRHLLNYLFFMLNMISQLMLAAFLNVYHWCSHSMKTFIALIKDYKKQCWPTIQGFQLHRVKVLPPIVPKCEGFYLFNSVSVSSTFTLNPISFDV